MVPMVTIRVQQSGEEAYDIGIVCPPTVNGKPVYVDDDGFLGKRSPEGVAINIHDALDDLWAEWREEVPFPDTDSEFVEWLVEQKGWTEPDQQVCAHVIET